MGALVVLKGESPMTETWRLSAACTDVDPEWFFPKKGSPEEDEARKACYRCPVKKLCAETALDLMPAYEPQGIWSAVWTQKDAGWIKTLQRQAERPQGDVCRSCWRLMRHRTDKTEYEPNRPVATSTVKCLTCYTAEYRAKKAAEVAA